MPAETAILPKVIALCGHHGFIYKTCGASSTGTSKLYDLGPLGVELKQNICKEWWYSMVTSQGNIYGVESPSTEREILMRDSTTSREQNSQNVCEDTNQGPDGAVLQQKEQDHLPTQSPVLRTSLYQGILLHYLKIKDLANKQLPFGIAQKGKCFRIGGSHDVEQFVFYAQEFTQLSMQYYCTPKAVTQILDTWQRDRLEWWRKFAENPSNFIATDIQTKDEVQTLDIQYKFPWGPDTIERIYNRGKQPMEELYWWMKNGGDIEGRLDKMGNSQPESSSASTSEQSEEQGVLLEKKAGIEKRVMDVLKGRDGRRTVIPHTLEMTTGLERGMLAYLLDGYSEKREEKSKKDVITEVMNLHAKLTPVKVAIVMKGSSKEQLRELSQYLQVEFRKSNINVIADNSTQAARVTRFDAMGILFTIILHEKTIKEGIVAVRQRGENILQSKHVNEVKEFVQRHLEYV